MKISGLKAAKGLTTAALAIAGRATSQGSTIVLTLVSTRFLSPTEFGVFALATVFVTLSRTMLYVGPFEVQMKAPDLEDVASECLTATYLLASLWALLLIIVGLTAPVVFRSAAVGALALSLAPSNFIAAMASWQESLLLREGRLRNYYLLTAGVEIASVAAAIVLLFMGAGLYALVSQIYARAVLLAMGYRGLVAWPRLRLPRWEQTIGVLTWSSARYGATLVSFLSNYAGDLILGVVLSPAATGLYRASNRVVTALADLFSQPASVLSLTRLSELRSKGLPPDGLWLRLWSGIAVGGVPALVGLAIVSPLVTPLFLGPQWAAAASIVSILSVARIFTMATTISASMLIAYDRQKFLLGVQMVGALVVAALTLLAAKHGVAAVAIVQVVAASATAILIWRRTSALGGVTRADWRETSLVTLAPAAACLFCGLPALRGSTAAHFPVAASLGLTLAFALAGWAVVVIVLRRPVLKSVLALAG